MSLPGRDLVCTPLTGVLAALSEAGVRPCPAHPAEGPPTGLPLLVCGSLTPSSLPPPSQRPRLPCCVTAFMVSSSSLLPILSSSASFPETLLFFQRCGIYVTEDRVRPWVPLHRDRLTSHVFYQEKELLRSLIGRTCRSSDRTPPLSGRGRSRWPHSRSSRWSQDTSSLSV